MLEQINKIIEVMDGLTVNFKVGAESELTIKGNFIAIAKVAAKIAETDSIEADQRRQIRDLEEQVERLKRKGT